MPRARTRARASSRTSTRTRTPTILKAEIGRFDGDMHNVHFNTGDTVQVLLTKSGLVVHEGESINDERGNDVTVTDLAKTDKSYYITGSYKQGC